MFVMVVGRGCGRGRGSITFPVLTTFAPLLEAKPLFFPLLLLSRPGNLARLPRYLPGCCATRAVQAALCFFLYAPQS